VSGHQSSALRHKRRSAWYSVVTAEVRRAAHRPPTRRPASARFKLDICWVKDDLPTLDQDDEITLAVESLADSALRVIGITSARKRDGTESEGLIAANDKSQSTSSRSRLQDDDMNTGRFIPATGIGTQPAVRDAAAFYTVLGAGGGDEGLAVRGGVQCRERCGRRIRGAVARRESASHGVR
jgi:hypothetical protein